MHHIIHPGQFNTQWIFAILCVQVDITCPDGKYSPLPSLILIAPHYGRQPNKMDTLLARLGAQAMNMAIRSGITITSAYAIQQYGRLVAVVDDKKTVAELKSLQQQLNAKIKIITPTIDLIEFKLVKMSHVVPWLMCWCPS